MTYYIELLSCTGSYVAEEVGFYITELVSWPQTEFENFNGLLLPGGDYLNVQIIYILLFVLILNQN